MPAVQQSTNLLSAEAERVRMPLLRAYVEEGRMKIKAPFRIRKSAIPGFWCLLRAAFSSRDRVLANNPLQLLKAR